MESIDIFGLCIIFILSTILIIGFLSVNLNCKEYNKLTGSNISVDAFSKLTFKEVGYIKRNIKNDPNGTKEYAEEIWNSHIYNK